MLRIKAENEINIDVERYEKKFINLDVWRSSDSCIDDPRRVQQDG